MIFGAMGRRGTGVAREAADLILLDDNFTTIVDTVKDGRRIFDNLRKAIGYVLVIHIPIALAALLTPLLHMKALLLPIHVVLLELIIDPTCSIVFERQPAERDLMNRPPRLKRHRLFVIGGRRRRLRSLRILKVTGGGHNRPGHQPEFDPALRPFSDRKAIQQSKTEQQIEGKSHTPNSGDNLTTAAKCRLSPYFRRIVLPRVILGKRMPDRQRSGRQNQQRSMRQDSKVTDKPHIFKTDYRHCRDRKENRPGPQNRAPMEPGRRQHHHQNRRDANRQLQTEQRMPAPNDPYGNPWGKGQQHFPGTHTLSSPGLLPILSRRHTGNLFKLS